MEKVTKEEVKSTSLRNLYKLGVWKTVSNLSKNETGYPFVTLLNSKGRANNLYFGKKSAEIILNTFNVGDSIVSALAEAEVIQTINKEGETRFKISISNNSNYASSASIMEVFGDNGEKDTNFDLETFQKEWYKSDLVETTQENVGATSNS